MSQALITLENHGIIHRDIKTKNIFVTIEESFKLGLSYLFFLHFLLIILIGDYGVARIIGMTTNSMCGTEFD